jgi:polyketide cyclase/dehydrase/lipid transport protein
MLTYESEVVVARPPDVVFPYLIEEERQALWSDVPMRKLTEGPFAAGSRLQVTFGMGPLKARVGLELTAVDPGRRLAFGSFSGPIRWDGEYRLEPSGSGSTRLSQHGTLRFLGLWRVLEPVIGAEIRNGEIKELERLKAVVESRHGGPG